MLVPNLRASALSNMKLPAIAALLVVSALFAAHKHGSNLESDETPVAKITKFPFNTFRTEQEMAFADDGTFVFTNSWIDTALAPGDILDIYISKYDAATKTFTQPLNMGLGINSVPNKSNPLRNGLDIEPFISPDGNRLYLRSDRIADPATCPGCEPASPVGGFPASATFLSMKGADGKWSTPKPLPHPILQGDHCVMELRDGKTLCFTSQRPGGFGGPDIWCAPIIEHGKKYGTPVNQGPNINTPGMELHFAQHPTDGHVSFASTRGGDPDIWTAKPDGAGGWLPPMRQPISKVGDFDICPTWTPGGDTMFWFSTRADIGTPDAEPMTFDIFSVDKSELIL